MMKKNSHFRKWLFFLSAASYLAKMGHHVEVFEKNDSLGGRARQLKRDGFTFDMGPSWYWMPDVFENILPILAKNHLTTTN